MTFAVFVRQGPVWPGGGPHLKTALKTAPRAPPAATGLDPRAAAKQAAMAPRIARG